MLWLLLLFIHVFGLAGFNLTLRKSLLDDMDRFTLATIMQTGLAVPALFLVFIKPPQFSHYKADDCLLLAMIVMLNICLHVSNVKALQYLETGVYSVIYNLRILITTVLGILFLNESLVWSRVFGGLLILLAIIIVRQKGSKSLKIKGMEWGIAAAFIISFLNTSEKTLINHVGLFSYFPVSMIITAIIMWAYLLATNKNIQRNILIQPKMMQLMTLRAISGYAFTGALAAGALVSVANYVSGMSVILMVVLGVVLLGERDYLWRKAAATTVAVTGLTIVLLSHLL